MLILVAVTVNLANENGGLFVKTREAKQDTAYKAEEENLATYMYGEGVYDAIKGEVNLDNLKANLDNSGEWGTTTIAGTKLTVIGKQSGKIHIIDKNGTMSENKDGEDEPSTGIVGTYYGLGKAYFSGSPTLKFNKEGQVIQTYNGNTEDEEVSTGTYTYDENTKTGTVTITEYDSSGGEHIYKSTFILIALTNNEVLELLDENDGETWYSAWAKEKHGKIIDLGKNIYKNGDKTIEFDTYEENGEEAGEYVIKQNGSIIDEGDYVCYGGRLNIGGELLSISEDLLKITWNDEIYTKQ